MSPRRHPPVPKRTHPFFDLPAALRVAASLVVALGLVGYLGIGFHKMATPPPLEVYLPSEGAKVSEIMWLRGKTTPENTVFLNGMSIPVRTDGTFAHKIVLSHGANPLTVIARSKYGKERVEEYVVVAE